MKPNENTMRMALSKEKTVMMRATMFLAALAVAVILPATSFAGAMIKEHECVGRDTVLDKTGGDAGCTPIGSPIAPPGGPGNVYGTEDVDQFAGESFSRSGMLEMIPTPSGMWQSIPTIKEPGFRQAGFPASAEWRIGLKSSSILSNIEVACSVCAQRPQSAGPGQTYIPHDFYRDEEYFEGDSPLLAKLNKIQEPWRLSVRHRCSSGNPTCSGTRDLYVRTIPGLLQYVSAPGERSSYVEWQGCKPKVVVVENDGMFFRGDTVDVRVDVPATAALHANLDVTSCQLSYIRGCLPGEGAFKDICQGEP